jgi:hypothetical protein
LSWRWIARSETGCQTMCYWLYTGVGKSKFAVVSSRNTGFIFVLLLLLLLYYLFVLFVFLMSYYYCYCYFNNHNLHLFCHKNKFCLPLYIDVLFTLNKTFYESVHIVWEGYSTSYCGAKKNFMQQTPLRMAQCRINSKFSVKRNINFIQRCWLHVSVY